jgi:hypothetical protein
MARLLGEQFGLGIGDLDRGVSEACLAAPTAGGSAINILDRHAERRADPPMANDRSQRAGLKGYVCAE